MLENVDKFLINGKWVAPLGSDWHVLMNPATEKPICKVAMGNVEDVDVAVAAAKAAFESYSRTTTAQRRQWFKRLLELYLSDYDKIADLMTMEMGVAKKFSRSAQAWVGQAHLERIIEVLDGYQFEEKRDGVLIAKEPVGVCALITPWNWPMNQLVVKVAPALAAGCTMVAKPSEYSPLSSIHFSELVRKAGFPAGVYNCINGTGAVVGERLASHPDVDMVSITGSTRAGVAVARAAAETVKRVHQELGGKSANIIFDDVDFADAVGRGVQACFGNCGQSCIAPSRMLVPFSRLDEAAGIAALAAEQVRVGPPTDEETDQGPVVNKIQYDRIQKLIEKGIQEGAKLVAGGTGRPNNLNQGYFVRPTVFSEVTSEMTIAREEIFGPVLSILGYRDEEHAVEIANNSIYGLAGYIQTTDAEKAARVARRLRVGMVFINDAGWNPASPFGGYKQSGNGREHGEFGLTDFLELKAIAGAVVA